MQCQHHQLPVSDSQKIVGFWFLSIFSSYLLFWETYRLFCMYADVKNSLHYVYAQTYLDYLHIHCSHLTSPVVLLLPLSGSSFSTYYTFFAARFIISQRASVCKFTLQIIPLFIICFPPCAFCWLMPCSWFQFLAVLFPVLSPSSCPAFCLTDVSTWLLCLRLPIQLENMPLYRFERVLGFA